MPLTLLTVGVIFPISFMIQYSVGRRERVLLDVASLKASVISLYVLAREWPPKEDGKVSPMADRMKNLLVSLMEEMAKYISHHDKGQNIYTIYEQFDEMFSLIEEIRVTDDWVKSVISRAYQYHRYMINDFERIRTVTDYRTPSSFRGYASVWLTLFPVFFGPYFANLSENYGLWAGIYSSILCSLMLVTLSNINDDLEDPFDGKGVDDLNMEMMKEPNLLFFRRLEPEHHHKNHNHQRNHGQKPSVIKVKLGMHSKNDKGHEADGENEKSEVRV